MENVSKVILVIFALMLSYCSAVTTNSTDVGNQETGDWLIPEDEVVDGGVPKDGIRSIDDPKFKPTKEIEYVDDHRLIVGIRIGDVIKGYPHQVMDHHEIVNDQIGQLPYSLTYCPLTGTGIAWERTIDGEAVEFGVSGLLFRNNLIPFDRKTDTHYSQMQMRGVNGSKAGKRLETFPVIQTTWATWKKMYPDALVLTTETGHNRNYGGYLYGKEYLEVDSPPLFPLTIEEKVSRAYKKRLYGVIQKTTAIEGAKVQTYAIDDFGSGINLKESAIGDTDIIIAGSTDADFAVAFERKIAGTELNFTAVQDSLPTIMEDQEGNKWDIFGFAVEGPRKGERLNSTLSYYGYSFAWGEFFLWN